MILFISCIINTILIIFSNFLYIIYSANKQNLKEDINKIILDAALLFSLFLIIITDKCFDIKLIITYSFIILFLSLKNKRFLVSTLILFIIGEYIYIHLNILTYSITNILMNIFIFSISYFIINYIINESSKILKLKNLLKEYKKESDLKISLFKITHEIKNPLAVVKGYLTMINIDNKDKSIKYLNIINSEVERTINLLNDFMQFSKIEINKTLFNLSDLLDEAKNILISLIENKNITLNFKTEDNIKINADYNRIKQVLINIIKNSIEASFNDSIIDITCYINKDLNIIIKDYGIGMNNETLNNLFIPFNTTKEKGTGLGVCLSKEIIEAHKGKITYSSVLNKGTIVKIVLPNT